MYEHPNNEGINHHWIKQFFYKMIPKYNSVDFIEKEYAIDNQIIDVYVILKNGQKIAIEIQCSKLSRPILYSRTKDYTDKGIYTLWIIDSLLSFHQELEPYIRLEGAKVTRFERELHHYYLGRYYCISINKKNKKITFPYPIHLESYSEIRMNDYTGNHYEYFYKTYRNVIFGDYIKDLRLVCTENPYLDLKIARFYDKKLKFEGDNKND